MGVNPLDVKCTCGHELGHHGVMAPGPCSKCICAAWQSPAVDSAHLRAREQRDMHSQTPLLTNAEHTAIATLIASLSKGRT